MNTIDPAAQRSRNNDLAGEFARLSVSLARAGRGVEALAAQVVSDAHRWAGVMWGKARETDGSVDTFAQVAMQARPQAPSGVVTDAADVVELLRQVWVGRLRQGRTMVFESDLSHLRGAAVPGVQDFAPLVLGSWGAQDYLAGPGSAPQERVRATLVREAVDQGDEAMVTALARMLLSATGTSPEAMLAARPDESA